ncbi:hypothetical protein MTO96_036017 [Rhipicephalus appendiculatus]
MGVEKPTKTFFSEQPRCDQKFKMNDDNNVVYLNLRSVLFFLGCVTTIIICSVTLFNIVASRFSTPASLELDTPPSAGHAPLPSAVYYAPVSGVAPPSLVPAAMLRKKGAPKRSAKTHKRHTKHKKRTPQPET